MAMWIERWWFAVPLQARSILHRRRVDRELDDELQFHLEHKIEEGITNGLPPDKARYTALRAMEGIEQRKEEMRDMRRIHWLTDFVDDLRYAVRSLRRTPGLTAFVVMTLALGIGIPAGIFPIFDGLVLRPPPVPHASRLVTLVSTSQDDSFDNFSYREYLDIRDTTRSYEGVTANMDLEAVGFSADPKAIPRVKGGTMVSGNYFQVLGVEPTLGRGFRDDEDQVPGRDAVIVLGPTFWKAEFNSDPAVVGRRVRLNGANFTIIGVAPDKFTGLGVFAHPDFYIPLAMARIFSTDSRKNFREDRDDRELSLHARLKLGATIQQAQSELALLANHFERQYPKLNRRRGAAVHTDLEMRTQNDASEWKFGLTFFVLALAVMLVACTNVAGLLLSRARTRKREIAIRLAIGAGRFRLIRLLLTESLVLASLGGLAGVAIGYAGVLYWGHFKLPSDLPLAPPVYMDTRVLWASVVLTGLCALICGLTPALQSTRQDLVNGLKTADVDTPGRRHLWGRDLLVVAQVSVSLMLLTAAFVMVRGFERTWNAGAGFAADHMFMARFDPHLMQYSAAQTRQFYTSLAERMRAEPGVRSVALTENIPLGFFNWDAIAFVPEGFPMPRDRENFTSILDTVDEGYFTTMGVPIVHGRGIAVSDTAQAPRVAVVNEQFAKHYWAGADAVGKHLRLESRTGIQVEIVGVARTLKYQGATEKPMDFVYLPLAQHPAVRMFLLLRSSGDPLQMMGAVRRVVSTLDPNLPIFETGSFEHFYYQQARGGAEVALQLVITMGSVGMLLAIAGLYGLVAFNVNRRTREIGIRMAIGAKSLDVLRLVMRQGLFLVAMGTVVGLGMGLVIERFLNSMILNSGGVDFTAYVIVVPSLLLMTILAAYLPARKACRIAPTQALRYE